MFRRFCRRFALLLTAALLFYWGLLYWREHRFDKVIADAARRYQVDPALVKAVIWEESRFNPDARGRAGELGLMQVREIVGDEWASAERAAPLKGNAFLDPAVNTMAGTWFLKHTLLRYQSADDPVPYALADYNAGRGNVLKWRTGSAATNSGDFINQIAFPGTRAYVQAVLRRYQHYR